MVFKFCSNDSPRHYAGVKSMMKKILKSKRKSKEKTRRGFVDHKALGCMWVPATFLLFYASVHTLKLVMHSYLY